MSCEGIIVFNERFLKSVGMMQITQQLSRPRLEPTARRREPDQPDHAGRHGPRAAVRGLRVQARLSAALVTLALNKSVRTATSLRRAQTGDVSGRCTNSEIQRLPFPGATLRNGTWDLGKVMARLVSL